MNSGKIIICNFSKTSFGGESSSILGKFFISLMQAHALKRAYISKEKRPSSFLFIDECQRFLTSTVGEILEEARKYRLFMILANQFIGQNMSTEMKNTILANTGLKIAGVMNSTSMEAMCREMSGIKIADFKDLEPYQFFLYDNKYREMGTRKIKVPDYLVKKSRTFYMKKKRLRELLLYMVDESGYYEKVVSEPKETRIEGEKQDSGGHSERKIFNPGFDD